MQSALGLTTDQAREVNQIQAGYRPKFAAKRLQQNTELRKLRRARIANDTQEIAQLEQITASLHEELRQIRLSEDEDIRKLLTAEQKKESEDYIKLRKEMVGSSRDDKDLAEAAVGERQIRESQFSRRPRI